MKSLLLQSFANVNMVGIGIIYRLFARFVWYIVAALLLAELAAVRLFADYAVSDLGWDPGPIMLTVVMPGLMFIVFSTLYLANVREEYQVLRHEAAHPYNPESA